MMAISDTGIVTDRDRVRADLAGRIAALDVRAPYISSTQIGPDLDAIRRIAHEAGFDPAVTVAHFFGAALKRGGPVHGWLSLLAEAVNTDSNDVATCSAFAATCSQRLAA